MITSHRGSMLDHCAQRAQHSPHATSASSRWKEPLPGNSKPCAVTTAESGTASKHLTGKPKEASNGRRLHQRSAPRTVEQRAQSGQFREDVGNACWPSLSKGVLAFCNYSCCTRDEPHRIRPSPHPSPRKYPIKDSTEPQSMASCGSCGYLAA